jgi:hypothetical protein
MSYDVLTPEAAQLWPYQPNWSQGFNVKRSYSTNVFDSRDDTEQRRAIRFNPRLSIQYATTLKDADRREAERWLRTYQNKPTIVPDFARWTRLTGASAGGTSALTVSPMPAWAAPGQRLVLCGAALESVLVASVAGTTITLAAPLTGSWDSGSVLRPTFFGLFDGRLTSQLFNKTAEQINLSLDVYPGGEPPRETGTAWATLGSREVFTLQPDFASAPSMSYLWPVEQVDFDRGRTSQFRPTAWPQTAFEADFNGLDGATAAAAEQFFDRMKGRRGAFYLPSWTRDGAFVSAGASSITVTGASLAQQYAGFDFAAYEVGIAVCMSGGDLYRRITAINTSGANSLITVSPAWGTALNAGNVARVSLMPLARFASDDMTTSWRTPLAARIRFAFQTVRR